MGPFECAPKTKKPRIVILRAECIRPGSGQQERRSKASRTVAHVVEGRLYAVRAKERVEALMAIKAKARLRGFSRAESGTSYAFLGREPPNFLLSSHAR